MYMRPTLSLPSSTTPPIPEQAHFLLGFDWPNPSQLNTKVCLASLPAYCILNLQLLLLGLLLRRRHRPHQQRPFIKPSRILL
jgi:hypothetical protein